ncbi:hypothetical protein DEO72_LG8g1059 [Vigna unguiculata]|uniref:Uncharacterized protein n=1 Tax=Vigna unguiculata TaxID=3917 RepID=A0A4D6MQW2_VIGUN|nr:hypothetical protein DEO72_LG8g1059 [Vigna unguiculata]
MVEHASQAGFFFLQRHATRSGDSAAAVAEVFDGGVDGAVMRESQAMFLQRRDSWWLSEARGKSGSQDKVTVMRLMASQQRLFASSLAAVSIFVIEVWL